MITVESLTRRYGGFTAVDDVLHRAARPGHRLPRSERRRQVHHDAHDGRPDPSRHPAPRPSTEHQFADIPNPGLEVGVLLDASAQHAGRTGREILTIAAATMGLPGLASTRCSSW